MRPGPIVGLLPVRNGERHLEEWLASAPTWCDAVVALDDGSTDATADILEEAELVEVLLRRPRRASTAGWDDAGNRSALLEAAALLRPAWIVQVDADERIPREDAAALRSFLGSPDALPQVAYGLRHVRMWGRDRCDTRAEVVYRVFAWEPGQRMRGERLHATPIPETIVARVPTSIRLQHLGATDPASIAERIARYREADPDGRWPTSFGGLDHPPERTVAWTDRRDPAWPLILTPGLEPPVVPTSPVTPAGADVDEDRPLLAVLLPVRDGAADLPGWLRGIRDLADIVLALDDGSTDRTRELLEADPLVRAVLRNPPRPSAAGWNDLENRQRLLEAAADLRPRWVLFLDVDERIPAEDRVALRSFLASGDADPRAAYAFRVLRMVAEDRYDRAGLWVVRMFAWRPGIRLEGPRLHLVPAPEDVPPARWLATTLRICHLASLDADRRLARLEKYRAADPAGFAQGRYRALLEGPGAGRPLEARDPATPVPLDRVSWTATELQAPALSAIVIARDDHARIEEVVRSVVEQDVPEPFEVIVVVSGSPRTARIVRERFPDVELVEIEEPVLPGAARNAGMARARGDIVSFPGSHIRLEPGSLAARLAAHRRGYPMVTGVVYNDNRTRAGWASYLLDHAPVLPGRPAGELTFAPPHCSYDREILERVGGFREDLRAGEDTIVNTELFRLGYRAWFEPSIILRHRPPPTDLLALARHHWRRGLGMAAVIEHTAQGRSPLREARARGFGFAAPGRRLRAVRRHATRAGLRSIHDRVRHHIAVAALAAWAGTWWGLATRAVRRR